MTDTEILNGFIKNSTENFKGVGEMTVDAFINEMTQEYAATVLVTYIVAKNLKEDVEAMRKEQ